MQDLTPRQAELLKVIISEYTESGEPVGSEILDKKYSLGISPATIRNEMVELAKKEYLKKEYFSSGRIPTAKAFRFYIQNLMKEKELSTAEEVSYKSDIWDYRDKIHKLLMEATRSLARHTHMLALSSTNLGDVYYFGANYLLDQKEFWDIDLVKDIFCLFDEQNICNRLLERFKEVEDEILFSFEEMQDEEIASVFGDFEGKTIKGVIGVMGPKRMRYEQIVPNVRKISRLIEEIISSSNI